jgi:hypothetical protein
MSDIQTDAERIIEIINVCGITELKRFEDTIELVRKIFIEKHIQVYVETRGYDKDGTN